MARDQAYQTQRPQFRWPRPRDEQTPGFFEIYREWLKMTHPAPGPNGLRRPLLLNRPLRPAEKMFYFDHFDNLG